MADARRLDIRRDGFPLAVTAVVAVVLIGRRIVCQRGIAAVLVSRGVVSRLTAVVVMVRNRKP